MQIKDQFYPQPPLYNQNLPYNNHFNQLINPLQPPEMNPAPLPPKIIRTRISKYFYI
jgi:hypothetical protein